jgi:hypothetical protein
MEGSEMDGCVASPFTVHEINGIRNRYGGDLRTRPADPEFYALLRDLRRIRTAGGIGLRVQRTDRTEAILMTFRQHVDPAITETILTVRQRLGLDPTAQEIRVVYGSVAANNRELAILSRSILEILIDLASFISVPETHVRERRVGPTHEDERGAEGPIRPLIRIGSAAARPLTRLLLYAIAATGSPSLTRICPPSGCSRS